MEERSTPVRGCVLMLATLGLGLVLGVGLTLGWLGLNPVVLWMPGQVGANRSAVALTPTATRPVALQGATTPGRRLVWRAPIPLDTDTRDPDMLVISRNFDRDTDTLVYLSATDRQMRWESPPLSKDGLRWVVTTGPELVYLADGARLLALERISGSLRWEAPLTDMIAHTLCRDCLQVFDEVVVALTQDGVVQAFMAQTGAPSWTVRLGEPTRQMVAVDGLIGVLDRREERGAAAVLRLLAPQDGRDVGLIEPACLQAGRREPERPRYFQHIGVGPASRELIWIVGSFRNCLIRVESISQTMTTLELPEGFQMREFLPHLGLWVGENLILSDERQLLVIRNNQARVLLTTSDYRLRPLASGSGVVLVEANRSRGSSRYELWAIDLATGARRWERILTARDPLIEPFDDGDLVANLVGDGVVLIEQQHDEEPRQVRYELIGLTDGASRARTTLAIDNPNDRMRGVLWGRDHAFLALGQLYALELASGQTVARWP